MCVVKCGNQSCVDFGVGREIFSVLNLSPLKSSPDFCSVLNLSLLKSSGKYFRCKIITRGFLQTGGAYR